MTQGKNSNRWLLFLIAMLALAGLACFSFEFHVEFDAAGDGGGTVNLEYALPRSLAPGPDERGALVSSLREDGWEHVRLTETSDGRLLVTADQRFGPGGNALEDVLPGFTFTTFQNADGQQEYALEGTADFSEIAESWRTIEEDWAVNGITLDSDSFLGDAGEPLLTAEEVQELIATYGEPEARLRVTLPGRSPVEARGGWTNSAAYLDGTAEYAEYIWRPGRPEHVALFVSRSEGGIDCFDYCQGLDPIGLWLDGDVYPNCVCDCGPENAFFGGQCVPCDALCQGPGQSLIERPGQSCGCLCNDPTQKWDPATGACVALRGDECDYNGACQPELGENCQTCADCGCGYEGEENFILNTHLRCEPEHPRADIRGCVFEELSDEETLALLRDEYDECTNAWLLMLIPGNLGAASSGGSVTGAPESSAVVQSSAIGALNGLPLVTKWQQRSGCLPSDQYGPTGGVVVGQEASDPQVCLMEYCRRVIGGGILALEQETKGNDMPVVQGTGTKIRSTEQPPQAPDRHYQVIGGQATQIWGGVDVHGDRPGYVTSRYGNTIVYSEYEIRNRPGEGVEIYLFEGELIHVYFDPVALVFDELSLLPGQMMRFGPDGRFAGIEPFDSANLDAWWLDAPYIVSCPLNAHQVGPDCYCDGGYRANPILGECLSDETGIAEVEADSTSGLLDSAPVAVEESAGDPAGAATTDDRSPGTTPVTFALVAVCFCTLTGLLALFVVALILRRRRQGALQPVGGPAVAYDNQTISRGIRPNLRI